MSYDDFLKKIMWGEYEVISIYTLDGIFDDDEWYNSSDIVYFLRMKDPADSSKYLDEFAEVAIGYDASGEMNSVSFSYFKEPSTFENVGVTYRDVEYGDRYLQVIAGIMESSNKVDDCHTHAIYLHQYGSEDDFDALLDGEHSEKLDDLMIHAHTTLTYGMAEYFFLNELNV